MPVRTATLGLLLFAATAAGEGSADRPLSEWVVRLKDKDVKVRVEAADAISDLAWDGWKGADPALAMADLVTALKDADWRVRRSAARALQFTPRIDAKPALPPLLALLKDAHPDVRHRAVSALAKHWQADETIIPRLMPILKDPDPFVRLTAIDALAEFPAAADDFGRRLMDLLKDENADVRAAAVEHLSGRGGEGRPAMPAGGLQAIAGELTDGSDKVRSAVIDVLAHLGDNVEPLLPKVTAALAHPDAKVRRSAVEALKRLLQPTELFHRPRPAFEFRGKPLVAPALAQRLADSDELVRGAAGELLIEFGPTAKSAVPVLIDLLTKRVYEKLKYGITGGP